MELSLFSVLNVVYIFVLCGFFCVYVLQRGKQKSAKFYSNMFNLSLWIAMVECASSNFDPLKPGVPVAALLLMFVSSLFADRLYKFTQETNN